MLVYVTAANGIDFLERAGAGRFCYTLLDEVAVKTGRCRLLNVIGRSGQGRPALDDEVQPLTIHEWTFALSEVGRDVEVETRGLWLQPQLQCCYSAFAATATSQIRIAESLRQPRLPA
jgi:hypothetical protein